MVTLQWKNIPIIYLLLINNFMNLTSLIIEVDFFKMLLAHFLEIMRKKVRIIGIVLEDLIKKKRKIILNNLQITKKLMILAVRNPSNSFFNKHWRNNIKKKKNFLNNWVKVKRKINFKDLLHKRFNIKN